MTGRQGDLLLSLQLKEGWRIEVNGTNYLWECSLPPRDSATGKQDWRLAGVRFGAPTLYPPDHGYSDDEVLCGVLATFMALEEHECLEWFRKDGRPVLDPHLMPYFDFVLRRREIFATLLKGGEMSGQLRHRER